MSPVPDQPFDPLDPLPSGRMAIEASAGTGKTFALTALATRFIAERGIAASELLIVTFTRAATSELRSRLRQQLIDAADYLAGERPPGPNEELFEHLAKVDRHLRLQHLRRAVTEFDAATIATIHGFATQARGVLGAASGIDPDARLVDDTDELVAEVCTDALAWAAVQGGPAEELPSLDSLVAVTRLAVGQPDLLVVPTPEDQGATDAHRMLRRLVSRSRHQLLDRRGRQGTLSFDDVLSQLRAVLEGPGSDAAIDALRGRFKLALIDEFQDTDSVQWDIFSRLFGGRDAGTALVVVGDPKQAIYGFRGADIHAYLDAAGEGSATERRSLPINWRSDGATVDALSALFDGVEFGDGRIPFVAVGVAEGHRGRRMCGPDGRPLPSMVLRLAIDPGIARLKDPTRVQTAAAARVIDEDLVAHVCGLLDSAQIPSDGEDGDLRPLRPSDIAVLVGTGAQGAAVQTALVGRGVPAVVANSGSVLASPAAGQMRVLLDAMQRPSDTRVARMFALSWFVGWSAVDVAPSLDGEGEAFQQLAGWQERLREWSELLSGHAVAEVFAHIWSGTGVVAKVLAAPDGDRNMTDLDHLVEHFHAAAANGLVSVARLLAMLEAPPDRDADADIDGSVVARRIESEDRAVQIMTIWTAKGLEFPVVCVPTLWRDSTSGHPYVFTDKDTGVRTFDFTRGEPWPDKAHAAARKRWSDDEAEGERLRLLYVALTRAKHQTAVWWANGSSSDRTALAHVLFARVDGVIDRDLFRQSTVAIPGDEGIVDSLRFLTERPSATVVADTIGPSSGRAERWIAPGDTGPSGPLGVARFDVALSRSAQRWSFSAITNRAAVADFDPYDPTLSDRGAADERDELTAGSTEVRSGPEGGLSDPRGTPAGPNPPVDQGLLASLPAGTAFGTLVHAVLEDIDFTSETIEEDLGAEIDRQLAWRSLDLRPGSVLDGSAADGRRLLIAGLRNAIDTPLGPQWGDRSLASVGPAHRLNELSFELRLGQGGRHPGIRAVGELVADHLDPIDPLRPWALGVADRAIDLELAGHLTGSVDLVMRLPDGEGRERFVVADYKTNQLTPRGKVPGAGDYRPGALAAAMTEHDYPLQALLYSVALHRYLRWRLDGYRPETHLGGVAYLFVRGMTGAGVATTAGRPHGVFSWPLPAALIIELSDLLDGRLAVGGVR